VANIGYGNSFDEEKWPHPAIMKTDGSLSPKVANSGAYLPQL